MLIPTMREIIEDFDKRHGGNAVMSGDWILYADGAERDRGGSLFEPPMKPIERAYKVLAYWKVRLKNVSEQFMDKKAEMIEHSKSGARSKWYPSTYCSIDEAKTILAQLKREVKIARKGLADAESQLQQLLPSHVRDLEKDQAENSRKHDEFIQAIKDISI